MDTVIQNNLPDTIANDFQKEFKQIPEINIFSSNIKPEAPGGIYGVMYKYNNYYTILNVVAQCFRIIHLMSTKIKSDERKSQIRKGYELSRIPTDISDSMTPEDQRRIYITPSAKEIKFARDFLIRESQKLSYPEEYKALQNNQQISENLPLSN